MGISLREYGWDKVQDPSQPKIDFDKAKERIHQITPFDLECHGVIEKARHNGYICPECGNGSGEDGTGIDIVYKNNHYCTKCMKCGKSFDNIHFLAHHFKLDTKGEDYKELLYRAVYDEFGFTDCDYNTMAR